MGGHLAGGIDGVRHFTSEIAGADRAHVAHLAAALGVKGRFLNEDLPDVAGGKTLDLSGSFLHQSRHDALAGILGVSHKLRVAQGGVEFLIIGGQNFPRHVPGGLGALALFLQFRLKTFLVHGQAFFRRHVQRNIKREAVSVIEPEGVGAGDLSVLRSRGDLIEEFLALRQGLAEAHFLAVDNFHDELFPFLDQRIDLAHGLHHNRNERSQERLHDADGPAVAGRAAQDPAQNVAPALVGRHGAVRDGEYQRPDMVRHHAVGHGTVEGRLLSLRKRLAWRREGHVGLAAKLRDSVQQRHKDVRLVIAVFLLHHGGQALKSRAGIHAGPRQFFQRTIRLAVELREDQIPKLHAALVVEGRRFRQAEIGRQVDMDLAARSARTRVPHFPEVVLLAQTDDLFRGHMLLPDLEGFVVVQINGHPEILLGQTNFLGQEFPGVSDGFFLKIRPERKIPQHLEEGVVPGGLAHVVQIVVLAARPYAFLAGSGARRRGILDPDENVLELVHAGVGEQKRRVILGDDRGAVRGHMPPGNEKFPKTVSELERS